jgi:hypothetical protein
MDRPRLKLVTKQPPKKVPPEAKAFNVKTDSVLKTESVSGGTASGNAAKAAEIMASIDRLERMMLNFTKNLNDLGSGLDYTEARLNRVVRLTKTLATIAGIPE